MFHKKFHVMPKQGRFILLCLALLSLSVLSAFGQSEDSDMYVEARDYGESGTKIYSMLNVNDVEVRMLFAPSGSLSVIDTNAALTYYSVEFGANITIIETGELFGLYAMPATEIGYNDSESSFMLRLKSGLRIGYGSWAPKDRQTGFGVSFGVDVAYEGITDGSDSDSRGFKKIIEVTADRQREDPLYEISTSFVEGFGMYVSTEMSYTFSSAVSLGIRYSGATRATLLGRKSLFSSDLYGLFFALNL